ncbi:MULTISPECIES: hypothetical protein [unclassified Campylobacter]|uniref:hypothetical protein n=1 Tax=unclassified Campylobacter TaxID=2593542 RepID=UPI001237D508|nr:MULTISPECIES: hypothetical protein [unclassified Campylobacter]KAA6225020.1 hypothetical protein FMM54_06655 [Campylobacter sp. LR185c]KAA6225964.1 hypothetical protein FMM57_06830 [Campylobacter sp. LR286c]KAA6225979.1 hypothetical protein FMM55_05500 [Campylobacter sp. LR196d]KAA6230350.1 hypothetical protein FMM56_06240 [Campylobacter sp. LR264d]KAA6230974.1 hypothetical protein FMM58_03895 [Campylobacter sp. LR291e]
MANDNLRQVVINVSARDFIVRCSEEFANLLEDDIALLSSGTKKIELKRFVDAFVKKSYENYVLEREIKKLIKSINEELPDKK